MNTNFYFLLCIILCNVICSIVVFINWKKKFDNCSLTIFHIFQLFIFYVFAPSLYILPWQDFSQKEWVLYGLIESTWAIISFAVGNIILANIFFKRRIQYEPIETKKNDKINKSPYREYFLISLLIYILTSFYPINIPTVLALSVVSNNFMCVNVCLLCWQAYLSKDFKELNKWIIVSLFFPFITLIFGGLLGYGMGMTALVFIFIVRFFRKFIQFIIISILTFYLGITFYINYMKNRNLLREVIWSDRPIVDKVNIVVSTFKISNMEWFDLTKTEHLLLIDNRLNQCLLLGASVEYIKNGFSSYALGQTIYEGIIGFIPRVLYPDKPVYAGSGDLVSRFTGLEFAAGTSVGIGQAMEFYINFGRAGIIIGFIILGILVRICDVIAAGYLLENNFYKFLKWFLVGIFLSNPVGSLVETTSSIGAGIVFSYLLNKIRLERHRIIIFFISFLIIFHLINRIIFGKF